jgi:hypothetical protein
VPSSQFSLRRQYERRGRAAAAGLPVSICGEVASIALKPP